MDCKYDCLKLENQLCFPLYVCAKEIVSKYKPFLDELDLTYTQYITMMVMWEHKKMNVKEIGKYLYLDSGTLTPLLKKLENKGLISRERDQQDERIVDIVVTSKGEELKEKAIQIPKLINGCVTLTTEEKDSLYKILHKLLDKFEENS